jgi:hypothetical protein
MLSSIHDGFQQCPVRLCAAGGRHAQGRQAGRLSLVVRLGLVCLESVGELVGVRKDLFE